jgi:8-oxo-dGTP pyrophosphatase MutT (NUDIX family)
MQSFTLILFRLPGNHIALQRRTEDAPHGAGKLGLFGGKVEKGETALECLMRELKEETNLNTANLSIKSIADFVLPKSRDFQADRHFYLYETKIPDLNFEVYEGDRAEDYTVENLKKRSDLTRSAQYVMENIL